MIPDHTGRIRRCPSIATGRRAATGRAKAPADTEQDHHLAEAAKKEIPPNIHSFVVSEAIAPVRLPMLSSQHMRNAGIPLCAPNCRAWRTNRQPLLTTSRRILGREGEIRQTATCITVSTMRRLRRITHRLPPRQKRRNECRRLGIHIPSSNSGRKSRARGPWRRWGGTLLRFTYCWGRWARANLRSR